MLQLEWWRDVVGFEGLYLISSRGSVRSVIRYGVTPYGVRAYGGNDLTSFIVNGYPSVTLNRKSKAKICRVHTLILDAFVGPRPSGLLARHLDGNRLNSRLSNLAWGTPVENAADKVLHGTVSQGERQPAAKLTADAVRAMRASNMQHVQLARLYGVSAELVGYVRAGKGWKHVR